MDSAPVVSVAPGAEVFPSLSEVRTIRDLHPSGSGGVWILNSIEPFLLHQSADGGLTAAIGRAGEGPEEIGHAAAILSATDSTVTFLDRGRNEVRTFDAEGSEVSDESIDSLRTIVPSDLGETIYGSPFKATLRNGVLTTSDYPEARAPGTAHLWNRRLVQFHLRSSDATEIVDLRVDRDRFTGQLNGAAILVPSPLWALCGNGSVARYLPYSDSIVWSGPEGAATSAPRSTRPLREEEIRTAMIGAMQRRPGTREMNREEMDAMLPQMLEQLGAEVSSVAPAYVSMDCDNEGRVWLQHFSVEHDWMGRGRGLDIVGSDGPLATDLMLPLGFRPIRLMGDRILGAVRDDLDVDRVATALVSVDEAR